MPSLATFPLPILTDDKEFEMMTRDFCCGIYGSSELYGRNGQKQNGVDIIHYDNEQIVGIQCKNFDKTVITTKSIDDMITLAESFQPALTAFVIATTAIKDAKIQNHVYVVSEGRIKNGKFSIRLVYWDEISDYIKSHNDLFQKYYGGIFKCRQDSDQPISTVEELKKEFGKYIHQYQVFDFMNVDPEIGMPDNLPIEIDCFVIATENLLHRAFMCQTQECYQHISAFKYGIQHYSGFLGTILFPTYGSIYTIQSPYTKQNIQQVRLQIKELQESIDLELGEIFNGVSLYK